MSSTSSSTAIVPPDKIKQYQSDPALEDRLNVYPSDALRYVSFNLALRAVR